MNSPSRLIFFLTMADIFTKTDARKLLEKKSVWFFGDSNMRGAYKDLIWLLEKNTLIELNSLKGKLEGSFLNDVLVKGGALHRGRNFQEIRKYENLKLQINIEYVFLTQCYSNDIQDRLNKARRKKEIPDVVVMNSCLWDITRWGPEGVSKYKSNIVNLIKLLKESLPSRTRVIWTTTPPISKEPRGGFFIKQIEFLKHTLRFDVMEANTFVSREFILGGFDVLDIHYHLLLQIHRRRPDGIHWTPEAVRHITNLFLTHLSISWNVPLPCNFRTPLLSKLQPKVGETGNGAKPTTEKPASVTSDTGKPVALGKSTPGKRKRGKKRNRSGAVVGQNLPKNDFAHDDFPSDNFADDDFDYDYKTKRFRTRGRRKC